MLCASLDDVGRCSALTPSLKDVVRIFGRCWALLDGVGRCSVLTPSLKDVVRIFGRCWALLCANAIFEGCCAHLWTVLGAALC